MSNDLTPLNDIQARLREKIKVEFSGLVPDEQWDEIVRSAVSDFLKTDLEAAVRHELGEEVARRIGDFFDSPEWIQHWQSDGTYAAGEKVREIVKENAANLVGIMVGSALQTCISEVRRNLSNPY